METLLSLMNDNTTNTLEEVFLQEEKIDRLVMTCWKLIENIYFWTSYLSINSIIRHKLHKKHILNSISICIIE